MLRLDLHIHSKYSFDGAMSVEKIIKTAVARGLDGIAICDHNVYAAHEQAISLAPEGFIVIPGVEYSTDAGHILALFVTRQYDLEQNERGLRSLNDLKLKADADGAVLIAAHPYRKRSELPDGLLETVAGFECINSRDAAKTPSNTQKSYAAAERGGLFITGGSDAHIAREIGACYTTFPDGTERTPDGIKRALLERLSQADGPGGRLRDQALGKLRRTRPRTFIKDIARLVVYTAKDVMR